MRRETQNILLLLLGGALVKIALNGDYLRYVKPAQQPWVILGGAVMLVLGAVAILRDLLAARASAKAAAAVEGEAWPDDHAYSLSGAPVIDDGPAHSAAAGPGESPILGGGALSGDGSGLGGGPGLGGGHGRGAGHGHGDDGHEHAHPARSAWLLVLPVLAVFLVAPPALGADSVTRTQARVPPSAAATSAAAFPPLPSGKVVELPVNEFVTRAGWDANGTLNGRTVGLSGFVVHSGGETLLARLVISCCAADAAPVTVHLKGGAAGRFPNDTWLKVTGQVVPGTATEADAYTPDFVPATVERIAAPKDPYEY